MDIGNIGGKRDVHCKKLLKTNENKICLRAQDLETPPTKVVYAVVYIV